MRERTTRYLGLLVTFLLMGCPAPKNQAITSDAALRPNVQIATSFPTFTADKNESPLRGSFSNMDPTWILGTLIDVEQAQIRPFDNFLSRTAQPKVTLLSEVVFKNFVESGVAANADWLSFIKSSVSTDTKAEVSVTKVSCTTMSNRDVDEAKLKAFVSKLPREKRQHYAVIIGYIDYALTASFFRSNDIGGGFGAYGAQIGGKWFNKDQTTATDHRLMAIWAPLPIVQNVLADKQKKTLREVVAHAITNKSLGTITKIKTLSIEPYAAGVLEQYRNNPAMQSTYFSLMDAATSTRDFGTNMTPY